MKNTRRGLKAAATLITASLTVSALATGASAAPSASIAGTVTSAETPDSVYAAAFVLNAEDRYEFVAGANVLDGQYSITGLEPGRYKLGFIDGNGVLATEYYGDAPTLNTGIALTVNEGSQLSGVNITLARGASIEGTVTSAAALDNADASAYILYNGEWNAVAGAAFDESGKYDFEQLPAGTYKVQFEDYDGGVKPEWWNDKRTMDEAETIEVASGETRSSINAELTVDGPQDPVTPEPPLPPTPPMPPTEPPVVDLPPTVTPNPEDFDPETAVALLEARNALRAKGETRVGNKVRVRMSKSGDVNHSISWRANGKKLGWTYSYYKIPKKLKGKRLTAVVTVSNKAGTLTRTLKFGKVRPAKK